MVDIHTFRVDGQYFPRFPIQINKGLMLVVRDDNVGIQVCS